MDSAPVVPQASTPASWTGAWAAELGSLVVVPADSENTAIVVYPDAPPAAVLAAARLQLVGPSGAAGHRDVSLTAADSLECGGAPVVRISADAGSSWVVGLTTTTAVLRAEPLESLRGADSARQVAQLARLASTVGSGDPSRFTGLPFAVLRSHRFTLDGTRYVAAHLVRRLPRGTSALEEHTLLVADGAHEADSLQLRLSERSEGMEETTEHFELLSAFASGRVPMLLLARHADAGTMYQLLERTTAGAWRVRWTRPLAC